MSIQRIISDKLPKAVGPYSHASYVKGWLYASGQLPIDPVSGNMPATIGDQTHQVFANLKALLAEKGMTFDHVVKTTVFLNDIADFATVNGVYGQYFSQDHYPALSAFQVGKLPLNAGIEIELVAYKEEV